MFDQLKFKERWFKYNKNSIFIIFKGIVIYMEIMSGKKSKKPPLHSSKSLSKLPSIKSKIKISKKRSRSASPLKE